MLLEDWTQSGSPLVFASMVFLSMLWMCVVSRKMMVIHLKLIKDFIAVQYKEVMSSIQTLSGA